MGQPVTEMAGIEKPAVSFRQTCPRRMSDWGPWKRDEGLDSWVSTGGLAGQAHIGLSCSFCGSLHPGRFMELAREGWVVGPTDKSYKAYLSRKLTEDEIAVRKAQWLAAGRGPAQAIRDLGARDGKTEEQIAADLEDEWDNRESKFHQHDHQEAKFYYQHLDDDQKREFIDLVNSGQMEIGYPGYFYRLPFFCTRAEPPSG